MGTTHGTWHFAINFDQSYLTYFKKYKEKSWAPSSTTALKWKKVTN